MKQVRHSVRWLVIAVLIALAVVAGFQMAVAQGGGDGEPADGKEPAQEPAGPAAEPLSQTGDSAPAVDLGDGEMGESTPARPPTEAPDGNQITYYKFISANTFTAYDDNAAWDYVGAGCVARNAGDPWYEHDLQLPSGAILQEMTLYFDDNDAADAEAHLFAFDGLGGGSSSIATVSSTGTPGSGTVSVAFNHVVDNSSQALSVRLDFNGGTNSSLQICGVRLTYEYDNSFLPVILNDALP